MKPQTPDNEVEVSSKQAMLTAQSDSVELYHALCDRSDDYSKALDACRDYRKELDGKSNEVARLRELLEKVLFELEKVPFQTPKLTAFTAHRLADRYREQLNQLTK